MDMAHILHDFHADFKMTQPNHKKTEESISQGQKFQFLSP